MADVEEDARAAARDDRVRVVVDHREMAVGRGRFGHVLARDPERRLRPAAHVPEPVVGGRARILDPPVPADDAVIAVAHARVRREAEHHRLDAECAARGFQVSLVLVLRDAADAEPGRPRARDLCPAVAALLPDARCSALRARPERRDRDELGRRARVRELVRERGWARRGRGARARRGRCGTAAPGRPRSAQVSFIRPRRLVSIGHEPRLARSPRGAALHAHRGAGDARAAAAFVACRLPGRPVLAAQAPGRLLGLRWEEPRGDARRQPQRRRPI